jgi:hypothetical protein
MRSIFISFVFLCCAVFNSAAQTDTIPEHRFYVGLQGGFLLQNNKLNKNPLYYFGNGMYAEINGGWRRRQLGWELALGHLTIRRDASKFNTYEATANDVLNAQVNNTIYKNARDSGQIGNAIFRFPQSSRQQSENFKGWYILTGPAYWLNNNKKWQFQINLKGGIISRQFGYYLLNGKGISPDSITISYNATTTAVKVTPTLGKATVTPNGSFVRYGMSQNLWESLQAQKSATAINEKTGVQFIARAGAQAAYFITKNISVNAAAQYWFMPSPRMTGMDTLGGVVNATIRTNARPTTPTKTSYQLSLKQTYGDETSLGFLSASLGIRFWLGGSKAAKHQPVPSSVPAISLKHLSISVTDADNQPVKEVTIKIHKEGESDYTETITHENGQTSLLENLSPGNYTISGAKGTLTTNKVQLTTEHFKSADKVIGIKLTLQPSSLEPIH